MAETRLSVHDYNNNINSFDFTGNEQWYCYGATNVHIVNGEKH